MKMESDRLKTTVYLFLACAAVSLITQLANMYKYNEAIDCDEIDSAVESIISPSSLLEPVKVSNEHLQKMESEVVYFVLSARHKPETREMIRETWGEGRDNVYFVVGQDCKIHPAYRDKDEGGNEYCAVAKRPLVPQQYEKLTKEHLIEVAKNEVMFQSEVETFKDILIMEDVDTYRSLSKKLKFMYRYTVEHLDNAKWIVKVDDDFFVRVDQFSNYLQNESRLDPKKPVLIGGEIATQNTAYTRGKYKEVPQYPPGALYPPFPFGSYGHVISRPVAQYIAQSQDWLFDYQGEDNSLGIWLKDFKSVKFETSNHMTNTGDCKPSNIYVVGHNLSPDMIKNCQEYWEVISDLPK